MNQNITRYSSLVIRLLVFKIGYISILAVLLSLWGNRSGFTRTEVRWPREGNAVFGSHFAAWDGAHYLLLATEGYSKGVPSCAFYPLWPIVLRALNALGISPLWGGIALANLASAVAWAMFHTIGVRKMGTSAANLSLILLITYPGSIFFQFPYTESLFLFGVMVLMDALDREAFWPAIAAAFLLPITRANGLFILLPLGWQLLVIPRRKKWLDSRQSACPFGSYVTRGVLTQPLNEIAWPILAAPILGWATYLGLMAYWTGNPLEGFVAQKNWGRHSISNLLDVPRFIVEMLNATEWHEFSGSLLDRVLFIPVALSLPLLWKRHPEWLLWVFVLGVLPAMSGGFTSFTRFGAMVAPCYWGWGEYLIDPSKRLVRNTVIGTFTMLHLVLLWRFVNFGWAG